MPQQANGVSSDAYANELDEDEYADELSCAPAFITGVGDIGTFDVVGATTKVSNTNAFHTNSNTRISPSKEEGKSNQRKRKFSDTQTPEPAKTPKIPSPPWKEFVPQNPTSFTEDGKRKSGRTNALPLELQPQGATRGRQAKYLRTKESKPASPKKRVSQNGTSLRSTSKSSSTQTPTRVHERTPSGEIRRNHGPPGAKLSQRTPEQNQQQRKSRRRSSAARHGQLSTAGPSIKDESTTNNTPPKPIKTLRLRFRAPPPCILNSRNLPPVPKYSSLQECLDQIWRTGKEEDQVRRITTPQARQEAMTWQRLETAAAPGGSLHGDAWLSRAASSQPFPDPPPPLSHQDYLCKHVKMFARALNEEQDHHRKTAKRLAHSALERWRSKQPKSELEISKEFRQRYKVGVCKELQDRWSLIKAHATQMKIMEYEKQQKELLQDKMDEMIQTQTDAVERRKEKPRGERSEDGVSDGSNEFELDSGASGLSGDSDSDDNDSSSDASSDSERDDDVAAETFDGLTGEELRKRIYGDDEPPLQRPENRGPDDILLPEAENVNGGTNHAPQAKDSRTHSDPGLGEETLAGSDIEKGASPMVELEEVDQELLDDDDDNSDDDEDDSDESDESGSDEASETGSDASDEPGNGLWGFLSKGSQKALLKDATDLGGVETPVETQSPGTSGKHAEIPLASQLMASDVNSTTDAPSGEDTPATTVASKSSDVDGGLSDLLDHSERFVTATTEASRKPPQTTIPSLLRGQLREYQHLGLDWLAGLYADRENGILADEMGLGKTIQTIALLAHLATSHEVWGPHLIVVPTSVMLNWEMEFKKFCPGFKILTYYGNQEERKAKRKGWMDNDRWHVCITSYQLALQDASALKRRNWHYIVLDEAHNIKNFRSQRWQTLLTFKSRARLLLTGTPLQNNLSELWSLLFFLNPEMDEEGNTKFKDLQTFSKMFNRPAEQILDHGREGMDDNARQLVAKLQTILRPHLLRRLKADVEKQMPKKFEHVVKCRLSKRQRQLYDGYMGLAGTRETFASGNYMSIISSLMQLRKVCNHPDLFETRQIVTSFAMPKSAVADFEIKELLVRKRMLDAEDMSVSKLNLLNLWHESTGTLTNARSRRLAALQPLALASRNLKAQLENESLAATAPMMEATLQCLKKQKQRSRLGELSFQHSHTFSKTRLAPTYGSGLIQRLTFEKAPHVANSQPKRRFRLADWCLNTSTALQDMFAIDPAYAVATTVAVQKFGCITPAVIAPDLASKVLTPVGMELVESRQMFHEANPFHEAQTRLSIAFPDKSLIQYDCGKLQQLDKLLRRLQEGGHRALIFTQMTKVLDILEQFLNLHGHRYLRLDGSTKVEHRQALTDQFNQDTRILAFILSSRSGGIGINLTGADTVIFYDLDWNPAMDKQCQDRCHRIGQTRDVHIYRFISEGTIEANILRKSNQKRMLDDVVIQEGEFTTEAFYRTDEGDDLNAEADAALDKVLNVGGTTRRPDERVLDQVEDKEDREAARQAEKEDDALADAADFQEKITTPAGRTPDARYETPRPNPVTNSEAAATPAEPEEHAQEPDSYEAYMLRFMEWELRDAAIVVQSEQQRKRAKKGKDHGIRIRT